MHGEPQVSDSNKIDIQLRAVPQSSSSQNKAGEPIIKRILPWFSILGVFIALATFFLNANLRRKELTFTYLGADNLVHIERKGLADTLSIQYGNVPINELYKLTFTVRNSGSTAIKAEDIKEPLEIVFPEGFSLLGSPSIEETRPQFTARLDKNESNSHMLNLTFPLLNPGDELRVSVDSLYLGKQSPVLVGRIVDVKQITNVDASTSKTDSRTVLPFIQNATLRHAVYWTLVAFDGIAGAFFVVIGFFQISKFLRYQIWQKKWGQQYRKTEDQFDSSYDEMLKKSLDEYLNELSRGKLSSSDFQEKRSQQIRDRRNLLDASLRDSGVPTKPLSGMAEDWSDFFSMTGVFALLALLFLASMSYILTGPGV
jgi:hypothetical protein